MRSLPPCAGYSVCSAIVEGRDSHGVLVRRRCTRRALFMVETAGAAALTACRLHAGAAAPDGGRR